MSKNAKLLKSFVKYCEANPELRFWQALRNWCGWPFIFVSDGRREVDTFHWEDNKKNANE